MKAETTFSLKDQLFNERTIGELADRLRGAQPEFPAARFQAAITTKLPDLGLKECVAFIADLLAEYLPDDYETALAIVLAALPPPLDPTRSDDDFGSFIYAPFGSFVAMHGCRSDVLQPSLQGLCEITQRFSAEDPIRTFLDAFPDETLAFLTSCAAHPHYHVRRLASEGTRPLLPWSKRLEMPWERAIPLLDILHADPTRFVTRSVANHLNDISKTDPDFVVKTLARWRTDARQTPAEMAFIENHALRTLIKRGHPGALKLLGFGEEPKLDVEFTTSTPVVAVGTALELVVDLDCGAKQSLLIDYAVHFRTSGDKPTRKVFKLKKLKVNEGDRIELIKRHPMRLMTTRRLYEGAHRVELLINGAPCADLTFELVAPRQ